MAMRWCDSFDGLASADINQRYENVAGMTISAGNGRGSTNSLRGTGSLAVMDKYGLPNHATYGVAFAWKQSALGVLKFPMILLDGTTVQVGLSVDTTGTIFVFRNTQSTVLATSVSQVIFASVQHHIQFQATIHPSAGAFEVKVDGATVLTATGVNTRTSATNQVNGFRIGGGGNITYDMDDLYAWDGSGSSNNSFPGDVRVLATLPDGVGNSTQWTPSTGSNYQTVDDATPNTSDYVSDSTVNHKDTYTYANIAGSGTVLGAQLSLYASKADAGATRGIKGVCRSSSSETLSAEVILGVGWRYWLAAIYETDPATSAAWANLAALNAAEFGVQVST